MKKLLMLFVAVFAMTATSFAQVEAPAGVETAPSVKMKKNKRVRTAENTKQIPRNMKAGSTPAERTEKMVSRINERLIAKDPKLALTDQQRAQLVDIHMDRQLAQQARPKLDTEADKAAFKESRKMAAKEFKSKFQAILTPAQNEAYTAMKRERKEMKNSKKGNKTRKVTPANNIEKNEKF